jgi:hypothetical protein
MKSLSALLKGAPINASEKEGEISFQEKGGADARVKLRSTESEPSSGMNLNWLSDFQLGKSSTHELFFKHLEDFSFNLIDAWNLGDLVDDLKFTR